MPLAAYGNNLPHADACAENLLNKHHLSAGRRRVEVVITVPALKAQETRKATQIHLCLLLILSSIPPPRCPSVDRLLSAPPTAWRATHLWPVLRLTPKSRQSSVMVKWPLSARLTNRCF